MKFEPQCKTLADLHRKWARVLDMCEGTEARPEDGWKYEGLPGTNSYPNFSGLPERYEFSIGIVEGKHVFRGDVLYYEDGSSWIAHNDRQIFYTSSWNPPKQESIIPEGFTPWCGGEWTGHPKDEVTVILRGGRICKPDIALPGILQHSGVPWDIIAYKITKKYNPETVMVELTRKDAEWLTDSLESGCIDSVAEACRTALCQTNDIGERKMTADKDALIAELERKLAEQQAVSEAYRVAGNAILDRLTSSGFATAKPISHQESDMVQYIHRLRDGATGEELSNLLAKAKEEGRREAYAIPAFSERVDTMALKSFHNYLRKLDGVTEAPIELPEGATDLFCTGYWKGHEEGRREAVPEGWQVVPLTPLLALQHQIQVDEDGVMIGVSRQAVCEMLAAAPNLEGV